MEFALKEGIKGYKEQRVTLEDTAKSYGSGSMEVFATPAMIALMEQTAYNSVMSLLPEEWTTVGTELHIEHCKATPLSTKVRCESVLNKVEGRKLIFILTVYDEEDIIGKGTHVRCIVNTEKFLDKLKQRKE